MTLHSELRAQQRYGICKFRPTDVLKEIFADRCVQIKEDFEKYSRTFYVRYNNKYVKVVTDYNVSYVKTVLPDITDFNSLEYLINKLSATQKIVA